MAQQICNQHVGTALQSRPIREEQDWTGLETRPHMCFI